MAAVSIPCIAAIFFYRCARFIRVSLTGSKALVYSCIFANARQLQPGLLLTVLIFRKAFKLSMFFANLNILEMNQLKRIGFDSRFQNGVTSMNAPHMLGNQLNPASSMAQKMSDTLSAELEAHSIFTSDSTGSSTQLIGPPLPSRVISSVSSHPKHACHLLYFTYLD